MLYIAQTFRTMLATFFWKPSETLKSHTYLTDKHENKFAIKERVLGSLPRISLLDSVAAHHARTMYYIIDCFVV